MIAQTIDSGGLAAGRRLEYVTLCWNLAEAAVAVGAGIFASSVALIGFGVDSLIKSLSGGILLWRLQAIATHATRERHAQRLVGISFFYAGSLCRLRSGEIAALSSAAGSQRCGHCSFNYFADRDAAASTREKACGGKDRQSRAACRFAANGHLRVFVGDPASRSRA
jgi:hypothetical protein